MGIIVDSKTFKSGNSVALRLPKGLGIEPNERFEISRLGDTLTARRLPEPAEEAERLARFRAALTDLAVLPHPTEAEVREPLEFPDRPGL